jgi:hypothetical protein
MVISNNQVMGVCGRVGGGGRCDVGGCQQPAATRVRSFSQTTLSVESISFKNSRRSAVKASNCNTKPPKNSKHKPPPYCCCHICDSPARGPWPAVVRIPRQRACNSTPGLCHAPQQSCAHHTCTQQQQQQQRQQQQQQRQQRQQNNAAR